VPVTISYEYDPTRCFENPQLMAEANNEVSKKRTKILADPVKWDWRAEEKYTSIGMFFR
jgi:hypothetical protein